MAPEMKSINVAITSRCNLRCPDCCSNIPNRANREDVSVNYLKHAAEFFRGKVQIIKITGGEPLMHSQFDEIASLVKQMFNPAGVGIETNGLLGPLHLDALHHFDFVHVTVYNNATFARNPIVNAPDNSEQRRIMKEVLGDKMGEVVLEHIPRTTSPLGGICGRGTIPLGAYWNGKLYPCCVGDGVPGAVGIELTHDWQDRIRNIEPPCNNCWFSIAK